MKKRMNRRSFLKLFGFGAIAAMLPGLPVADEKPHYICCLDNVVYAVWIMNSARESYVSYDFWESKTPTWEEADNIPSMAGELSSHSVPSYAVKISRDPARATS